MLISCKNLKALFFYKYKCISEDLVYIYTNVNNSHTAYFY